MMIPVLGWTTKGASRHDGVMTVSAFLTAIVAPFAPLSAAGVSGVEIGDRTITVRFDDPVEQASSFVLDAPERIAIDVAGADPGATGVTSAPSGVVLAIRQGRFSANTTRIVFDLAAPTTVTGGSFAADGRSITLGIAPTDIVTFSASAQGQRKVYLPPLAHRAAPPRSRYSLTVPLGAPVKGLPRPKIYGAAGRPLVVIDAGHGGHDPGAISPVNGKREKEVTLAIARLVRDQLIASGRVRVALTRDDDRYLILRERSAIARGLKADLFISIHADSAAADTASGATIYTLSETASDREAQLLAQRENRADVINGVNLGRENREISSILVDLAQRETMNLSARFANLLKREGSGLVPFRADYHRMADLAVLKSPDMSSILFEAGYLTNTTDLTRISSPAGQASIATAIRKAVEIHFARRLASR